MKPQMKSVCFWSELVFNTPTATQQGGKKVLKVGQANQAFEGQYPQREIADLHSVKS